MIVFFDILGYKNIVSRLSSNEESELITSINDIVKKCHKLRKKLAEGFEVNVYSFSDNFIIALKIDDETPWQSIFVFFVAILQEIQFAIIIKHGLFIRGALVKGQLYAQKNFVYGRGLIRAYEIENRVAIYPRIIVDKELLSSILGTDEPETSDFEDLFVTLGEIFVEDVKGEFSQQEYYRRLTISDNVRIRKDFDGNYFISYLHQLEVLKHKHYYNNDNSMKLDLAIHLNWALINLLQHNSDKKIAKKYLWCCAYHNIFCKIMGYPTKLNINKLQRARKQQYIRNLLLEFAYYWEKKLGNSGSGNSELGDYDI